MLDVVRLHDDTSGANAEFAIMVRSRLKGLKNVRGQVLWQNTTMLAMCAELGFRIADDPGGGVLVKRGVGAFEEQLVRGGERGHAVGSSGADSGAVERNSGRYNGVP